LRDPKDRGGHVTKMMVVVKALSGTAKKSGESEEGKGAKDKRGKKPIKNEGGGTSIGCSLPGNLETIRGLPRKKNEQKKN